MRSPTAHSSCRPEHPNRCRCSVLRGSITRCAGSITTPAPIPSISQNFVIFTNYQLYVDAFVQLCQQRLASGEIGPDAFVAPGNAITRNARLGGGTTGITPERAPQMPAFLVEPGYSGITLINIGIGPSNARNITDHVAVLGPRLADGGALRGLENTQRLGDYVLAHGYVREDHVLDHELPLWVPIPALAEIRSRSRKLSARLPG